ncbi:glycogen debranching protein GlgX [Propylenella binzhouense]|uniref:Glycogen debranching protein GlgX n=1 Tax=Propylenella binzhouense TaxID=2555902 RepID=A0A964WT44_9HYPH|nr:glycogen debranching protein GlgX [Propylenella binzhouense]MYZ47629.1 glycogen debranching protein GlgX [Propylenella binzhouense]
MVLGNAEARLPAGRPHESVEAADGSTISIGRGRPLPIGTLQLVEALNVAVFSRHATGMTLVLFADPEAVEPMARIPLDRLHHRTGDIWHVLLGRGCRGACYALEAEGPFDPAAGHRFLPDRRLLDPYAPALVGLPRFGDAPLSGPASPRGLIVDTSFDWDDDRPPRRPWSETVIYEAHVRGLTVDPSAQVASPGRYRGIVEKIPYLQSLGVTAVELMPVQAFDPTRSGHPRPAGEPPTDYWGYNPVSLFAPMPAYAEGPAGCEVTELKETVLALHRAGIEVILDVVFNHTAEDGTAGPSYSFRGLDNRIYYMLDAEGGFVDFTGCGNTLGCNHPVVRGMIVDCLRHWATEYRVDGFRFDLASVLGRDVNGELLSNPPLLEQIAEDPILRDVKLIAEAWDMGGAYQVGSFPGWRWAEWNARFRDDVRRFWRGDPGLAGAFATRFAGSSDLFRAARESPQNSVNFITCHDGFTLNDLVSYETRHNDANGEENRDGTPANWSENNGVEGPTADPAIESMRRRQIRNMLATLFLSRGVPMLLAGDEFRRTQGGNNNAYCQDNPTSWVDWRLAEANAGQVDFVRNLIGFRRAHPALSAEHFYTDDEIQWLGEDGRAPDWSGAENRLGCVIGEGEGALVVLFNAARRPCRFAIPAPPAGPWRIAIDTGRDEPCVPAGCEPPLDPGGGLTLEGRTIIVLVSGR